MIIQERAELRSRQIGGSDAAAVNRDKNCTIAVTLEKNMRQSGRFSEMEIIAAVTKIAGAKAVMRNDSVAQVDPAGLIKRLCERWFYCGWAREAKRRMTRFTADQVQLLIECFDNPNRMSDIAVKKQFEKRFIDDFDLILKERCVFLIFRHILDSFLTVSDEDWLVKSKRT